MTLPAPSQGEPFLLTPGPLTTSSEVKMAMLRDWGSWDQDFRDMTALLRQMLLEIASSSPHTKNGSTLDCVPMQGSGTFSVEAMLGSFVPRDGKVLVLSNGAYGKRIAETLCYLGRDHVVIDKGDYLPPRGFEVTEAIKNDPAITDVVVVHCETSSGILNPIEEIAEAVETAGRRLLIDSMSAFGAIPADVNYHALVSSANKCIEGAPGFGFVIAPKSALEATKGNSHSLSLDVHAQWAHMNKTGQWRFTPPTHVIAAFLVALRAHKSEGGVAARGARYAENRDVLIAGMKALGFETLLDEKWASPIIVTFFSPEHAGFSFHSFYEIMKSKGFIIYPGKLTHADSFRIGCIGQVDAEVMQQVVAAVGECLVEMNVPSGRPSALALADRQNLSPSSTHHIIKEKP